MATLLQGKEIGVKASDDSGSRILLAQVQLFQHFVFLGRVLLEDLGNGGMPKKELIELLRQAVRDADAIGIHGCALH